MLALEQITLCCVDTRHPQLALAVLRRCQQQARFGRTLLITRSEHHLSGDVSGIDLIELNHIKSVRDYSRFMLAELPELIDTPFVLIVQWDGFIIDPTAWNEKFLEFDYIGAVWPQFKDTYRVGNGGFSLRSKKLLLAVASLDIESDSAEDLFICRTARRHLEEHFNIRFAPEHLANCFSYERVKTKQSVFGFHGLANMAEVLSSSELDQLVDTVPTEVFASLEARGFIKNLIRLGDFNNAIKALKIRMHLKSMSISDARLIIRIIAGLAWNRFKFLL